MRSCRSRWVVLAVAGLWSVSPYAPIDAQGSELALHTSVTERLQQLNEVDGVPSRHSLHEARQGLFHASLAQEPLNMRRILGMPWLTPSDSAPETDVIAQHPLSASLHTSGSLILLQPRDQTHSTMFLTTDTTERMVNNQDAGVIAAVNLQF